MTHDLDKAKTEYSYKLWDEPVAWNPDAEMFVGDEYEEAKAQGDGSHIEPPTDEQIEEYLTENYPEMPGVVIAAFAEHLYEDWFQYNDDASPRGETNAQFVAGFIRQSVVKASEVTP